MRNIYSHFIANRGKYKQGSANKEESSGKHVKSELRSKDEIVKLRKEKELNVKKHKKGWKKEFSERKKEKKAKVMGGIHKYSAPSRSKVIKRR